MSLYRVEYLAPANKTVHAESLNEAAAKVRKQFDGAVVQSVEMLAPPADAIEERTNGAAA